ncbi:hypothetical protein Bca4012_003478 [Brassica carinata]
MANSFILLADLKARRCSNSAEVRFAEVLGVSMILTDSLQSLSQEKSVEKCGVFMGVDMLLLDDKCLKHQRKWKSVPNYTKSWYDRGPEIYQAEKYRKGHVKTHNAKASGSVSASGMLYTGVKKLETVMVDAVCFSTFTSLLIVQS